MKMIIRDRCFDTDKCYKWRESFSWLPVKTISGKHVWGKRVFKRKVWLVWGTSFHMEPEVQYATAFDLIQQADKL